MAKFFRTHGTESALLLVIAVISLILSLITDRYFTDFAARVAAGR